MGCISSKSSSDEQPTNHTNKLTDANHTSDDALLLMAPKHDDMLTTGVDDDADGKEHGGSQWSIEESKLDVERSASLHAVKECDGLLQRIDSKDDAEFPEDLIGKKDGHDENEVNGNTTGDLENIEFQTVASLRQWLDSPRGGGAVAVDDYPTPKSVSGFYDNDNNTTQAPGENLVSFETSKQQEDETIIELVVVFDEYMKQLQIEEENILKQIHNTELAC